MRLQTDNYIVKGLKNGQETAFEEIHKLYFRRLLYFVEKLTGDSEEAKDIVAETFLKLWRKRDDFDSLINIKAFLYITAKNASFSFIRFMKRRCSSEKELALYLESELMVDNGYENKANDEIKQLILTEISNEIEALPERCRLIFKMMFLEKLTTKEIAAKLNLSVNTVATQKRIGIMNISIKLIKKGLTWL